MGLSTQFLLDDTDHMHPMILQVGSARGSADNLVKSF